MRKRAVLSLTVVGLAVVGVHGCDGLALQWPGGLISFNTIHVRLTNSTDFFVRPELYADDDDDTFFDFNITTEENFVDVGVLAPFATVDVALSCDRAGTLKSDHALFTLAGYADERSANDPKVTAEDDFDCGDQIEFVFYDAGDEFRTRVLVNGRIIEE